MRIWIDALARDACAGAGAGLRALDRAIIGVFTIVILRNYKHLPPEIDAPGVLSKRGLVDARDGCG